MNLLQTIAQYAQKFPDKPAIVHAAGETTYGQLATDIEAIASTLAARGMRPGAGVAIIFDESEGYLERLAMLALYRLGITSCFLPAIAFGLHAPMLPGLGIARALTFSRDIVQSWQETAECPLTELSGWMSDSASGALPGPPEGDFVVRMMFSSGTTGKPKPIALRHIPLSVALSRVAEIFQVGADARLMAFFSLYVAPGPGNLMTALAAGATLYLPGPEDWDDIWNYAAANRITRISAPPFILSGYLDNCPPGPPATALERITLMGARCPLDVFDKCQQRLPGVPMLNLYGSTEAGVIATGPLTRDTIRQGIVGPIHPYATVQIVDSQHQPLPPGSAGMLRMRSDVMATEYTGNPEATQACFKDGWFYSGDQALLRHDGNLVVVDRTNDVVNFGGRKISLRSIDEVALAQPGVLDACAFVYSNPKGFDEPWLAIVADDPVDTEKIFAAIELAGDTVVGAWPITEVPRNNGKPRRWTLSSAFARHRNNLAQA